ncbi:MAG: helix-turn-helix transcriptional regulator [Bacteroides sp.]|nr:helix-turn-helix transcriptional regulator [Bacteroides sp.]
MFECSLYRQFSPQCYKDNQYLLIVTIKRTKKVLSQKLTQEELGERIGVQRAQISSLEKGKSVMTLPTMSRIFKALGIKSGILDLGSMGKVSLW